MIKHIIFDFDDTLSDFQRAKELSKQKITPYLEEKGINTAAYWAYYEAIFEPLFSRYVNHELTVNEYRLMRFEHNGINRAEAAEFNKIYLNTVNKAFLFEDVEPVLKILKQRGYRLYVLTNGPSVQRTKIEACAVGNLFEALFISSELGVGKPSSDVYRLVLSKLNAAPEEVMMVGDSYENDCVAAEGNGILAVQINRHNKLITDYHNQIETLHDIFTYLS